MRNSPPANNSPRPRREPARRDARAFTMGTFGDNSPLLDAEARAYGEGETAMIPVDQLYPAMEQPRLEPTRARKVEAEGEEDDKSLEDPETAALRALGESIKADGQLQAIVVRHEPTGHFKRYEIVAGERRYRAALLAGIKELRAYVVKASDEKRYEMAFLENELRVPLNQYEECLAIARIKERNNYSTKALAAKLGRSKGYVENRLKAAQAPPELLDALRKQPESLNKVIVAAKIEREDVRRSIARRIVAGAITDREVAQMVRLHAPEPEPEPTPEPEGMLKMAASSHPTPLQQSQGTHPRPNYEPERTAPESRNNTEVAEAVETSGLQDSEARDAAARASTPAEAQRLRAQAHDKYLQQSGQGADVLSAPDALEAALRAAESLIEQIRQRREDGASEDDVRPLCEKASRALVDWTP